MKNLLKSIGLLLCLAASSHAAQGYTEFFAGRSAAPASALTLGGGSWAFTGGVAIAKFASTVPLAIPDVAVLKPANAAFTGNYVSAGIGVLGFKFRSATRLPSSVYVELKGGGAIFQRVVPVTGLGVWENVMISLAGFADGGWTVLEGRAEDFPAVLANVSSLEIKVQRGGSAASEYAVDDLYLDALPAASGSAEQAAGEFSLAWDALQIGAPYTMQESPSLNGPWKDATTVTATNRLQRFSIPWNAVAPQFFYRLRGPRAGE